MLVHENIVFFNKKITLRDWFLGRLDAGGQDTNWCLSCVLVFLIGWRHGHCKPPSATSTQMYSTSFYLLCDINGTGIADRYDRKNEYFVWSNNLSHKYLIKFILISNDFFYNLKIFSDKQCIFFNLYFANKNWMIDCINRIWINHHKIGPYDILCLNDFEMW